MRVPRKEMALTMQTALAPHFAIYSFQRQLFFFVFFFFTYFLTGNFILFFLILIELKRQLLF